MHVLCSSYACSRAVLAEVHVPIAGWICFLLGIIGVALVRCYSHFGQVGMMALFCGVCGGGFFLIF